MDERESESVLLLARSLLGVGKPAEAAELLQGLAAARPDDAGIRRLLALALLELGKYVEAEPVARALAATATGKDVPPAIFFYAHALWGCGKLDECRRQVDRYAASLAMVNKDNNP